MGTRETPVWKPGMFSGPASVALTRVSSCSGRPASTGSASFSDKWDCHGACLAVLRGAFSESLLEPVDSPASLSWTVLVTWMPTGGLLSFKPHMENWDPGS